MLLEAYGVGATGPFGKAKMFTTAQFDLYPVFTGLFVFDVSGTTLWVGALLVKAVVVEY